MEALFLGLFVVGLSFVALSFLLGFAHLGIDVGHHAHFDLGDGGHAAHDGSVSPINVGTIMTFLTWFGGVGYLLSAQTSLPLLLVLTISAGGGLIGGAVVLLILLKVIVPGQTAPMSADDYRLEGTLAQVSMPIGPRTPPARSSLPSTVPPGARGPALREQVAKQGSGDGTVAIR